MLLEDKRILNSPNSNLVSNRYNKKEENGKIVIRIRIGVKIKDPSPAAKLPVIDKTPLNRDRYILIKIRHPHVIKLLEAVTGGLTLHDPLHLPRAPGQHLKRPNLHPKSKNSLPITILPR